MLDALHNVDYKRISQQEMTGATLQSQPHWSAKKDILWTHNRLVVLVSLTISLYIVMGLIKKQPDVDQVSKTMTIQGGSDLFCLSCL